MTAARTRILVIEDEPAIADTLVYALRTEGFAPEWRATGRDGLAALREADAVAAGGVGGGGHARDGAGNASGAAAAGAGAVAGADEGAFALVILDVGLPDASGFDVCREIRAKRAVPVLFLTARSSEIDRVVGLELGGDDYVTKPFSPREVTARVRAILRRTQAGAAGSVGGFGEGNGTNTTDATDGVRAASAVDAKGAGGADAAMRGAADAKPVCHLLSDKLRVDWEARRAVFCGVGLELTRYEFRLLVVLCSRPGRVWSRDELMERVWEDPGASLDRTVDAHVKTLRAKLREAGEGGAGADLIQTHRGEGYSLRVSP